MLERQLGNRTFLLVLRSARRMQIGYYLSGEKTRHAEESSESHGVLHAPERDRRRSRVACLTTGRLALAERELVEGEDFYYDENGLLVFSATYHLKRGTCCESGCRHCPYDAEES